MTESSKKDSTEKPLRSLVKAITFRIFVLMSDSIVVGVITQKLSEVISVVLLTNLSSTILYYLHERAWNKVNWLKEVKADKTIHYEHFTRSLLKSFTFRLTVVFSDLIITTLITGSFGSAFGIIIFTNIFSTILYLIHERVWNRITWGKVSTLSV